MELVRDVAICRFLGSVPFNPRLISLDAEMLHFSTKAISANQRGCSYMTNRIRGYFEVLYNTYIGDIVGVSGGRSTKDAVNIVDIVAMIALLATTYSA